MIPLIYSYLLSIPVFVVIDFTWVGLIMRSFYQASIGHLMGNVLWAPGVIFYFIYTAGLYYFVIYPAFEKGSVVSSLIGGALFGFIAYATYDLTNMATLRDWPLSMTLVDMLWGTFLSALMSGIGFWLLNFFSR